MTQRVVEVLGFSSTIDSVYDVSLLGECDAIDCAPRDDSQGDHGAKADERIWEFLSDDCFGLESLLE